MDTNETVSTNLINRNVKILDKRTSIRLEPEMWSALREISKFEKCKMNTIFSLVYITKNRDSSFTSAIRVFIMLYYRAATTRAGHIAAGHGRLNEKFTVLNRASNFSDWETRLKA